MDSTLFMGYLVLSLITLGGFYFLVRRELISSEDRRNKPINELNKSLQEVDGTLHSVLEEIKSLKIRVDKHGNELDKVRYQNAGHEERIKNLENVQRDCKLK